MTTYELSVTGVFKATVEANNEEEAKLTSARLWREAVQRQNARVDTGMDSIEAEYDFSDGTESIEEQNEEPQGNVTYNPHTQEPEAM